MAREQASLVSVPCDTGALMTALGLIDRNVAAAGGGGIYGFAGLISSAVRRNRPDNCEPPGTSQGCTG